MIATLALLSITRVVFCARFEAGAARRLSEALSSYKVILARQAGWLLILIVFLLRVY